MFPSSGEYGWSFCIREDCPVGASGNGPLGGVDLFGKDPCLDHRFVFVLEFERSLPLPLSPEAKVESEWRDGVRAFSGVPKAGPVGVMSA